MCFRKLCAAVPFLKTKPKISVVRLHGVIGDMGVGTRHSLTLASVATQLEKAFADKSQQGVAISINSPGGSPVQSALIATRIRELADENKTPVFAFTEDVAASGGYWLACAGDEIYADENSIIGSIGVISAGFGFNQLIEKYGVERRVHTSGKSKSMLDPFKPEKKEDLARLKAIQNEIHESFIAHVKKSRGKKLKEDEKKLFSGEFWAGRTALDYGLVDGIGHLRSVMRDKFGEDVKLNLVSAPRKWLSLPGISGKLDMSAAAAGLIDELEARSFYARYGL